MGSNPTFPCPAMTFSTTIPSILPFAASLHFTIFYSVLAPGSHPEPGHHCHCLLLHQFCALCHQSGLDLCPDWCCILLCACWSRCAWEPGDLPGLSALLFTYSILVSHDPVSIFASAMSKTDDCAPSASPWGPWPLLLRDDNETHVFVDHPLL